MWKLESAVIVLSALFSFSQCQESQNYLDVSSYVKSYTAKYNKSQVPTTVTLKNRLYTVILDNDTINLTSLDTGNDRPLDVLSCKLLTPDALIYNSRHIRPVILGNGKLLLVTPPKLEREEAYCVHIIIDPFDCSSQKIVKVPCQSPDTDRHVIAVIPYQDSYDVITNYISVEGDSQKLQKMINSTLYPKNPQRFNDKGEQIELDYSLEPDSTLTSADGIFWTFYYSINTIKPFDASEGYYCSYETQVKGIVLQRLNSRFEIVKEISSHDDNIKVSTTHGHINYCSFVMAELKITCKYLNADLEVYATTELPKLNIPSRVLINSQVINLPNHRGLVVLFGYGYMGPRDSSFDRLYTSVDFYLQRVDADGSALQYYWKIGNASQIYLYDLHGIVDSGSDFCYEKLSTMSKDDPNVNFYIHCLDLYTH